MNKENITPKKVYARLRSTKACRLCLQDSSRHGKIFSKVGEEKKLEDKTRILLGINVVESDSSSDVICEKCERKIETFWTFRTQVLKAQGELTKNFAVKRIITPTKQHNSAEKIFKYGTPRKSLNFPPVSNLSVNKDKSHNEKAHQKIPQKEDVKANNIKSVFDQQDAISSHCTQAQVKELYNVLTTRSPKFITNAVQNVPAISHCINKQLVDDIGIQSKSLCKKKDGSVLLAPGFEELSKMQMFQIWSEMTKKMPLLVDMFSAVTGLCCDFKEIPAAVQYKFCFIYSILMNQRWHSLSLMQRVNTVLMIEGGGSRQLLTRFNKLGITLSYERKLFLLDLIGGHFADKAVEAVKNKRTLRGTGDNWDIRVLKGHMTKEVQNDDLHMFASNIYVNRLSFTHLQNETPKRDLTIAPISVFTLSVNELKVLKENFKVLISRICYDFLPKFKFLKRATPNHIAHQYTKEMSQKSSIITLPIINANEASYNDCAKILRTYEDWIFEIYQRAGLIQQRPGPQNPEVPEGEARPDQPGAHILEDNNDPMREMKIPFSGDQLTRVRFSGTKDLLADAHTPSDRFEHCSPFKPVMWHTKASLLQYCFSLLYDQTSTNQPGTLKYFRERYNRKNVTPSKVHDSYDGCEEFFLSVGTSYIVVALMKFFGMESLESYPTLNKFEANIMHKSNADVKLFYDEMIGKFVNEFIFQTTQAPGAGEEEDGVKNYSLCLMFLSVTVMQLKDTAAEGDGSRNLINQKLLLSIFKSLNAYSKYAIELFVSIAQIECMLSERMSEEFKWGFFSNWKGGIGKNIEDDLAQEICNCISKNAVKRMGGNKTVQSISKICRATSGLKLIVDNYDTNMNVTKHSTSHTSRNARADELSIINELLQLDPFQHHSGRSHNSFQDIRRSPLKYLDFVEFRSWLERHKRQMSALL